MTRLILIGVVLLAVIGLGGYVAIKQSDGNDRPPILDLEEERSVAAVEMLGGQVRCEPNAKNFRPVIRAYFHGRPVTDEDLREFAGLSRLEEIDLSGTRVTDEGLKELKAFRLLTSIDLSRTGITGHGLVHLKELSGLTKLYLARTAVTDAGLAGLNCIPSLRDLNLSGTGVTNAGLVHLKALTELDNLNLAETKITGQAAKLLAGLGLHSIDVSGIGLSPDEYSALRDARTRARILSTAPRGPTKQEVVEDKLDVRWSRTTISDEWLAALAAKGRLDLLVEASVQALFVDAREKSARESGIRVLALSETKVTDAAMRSLRGFDKFTCLDVGSTAITDAGLADIAEHHTLTRLYLDKTRVTDAGLMHIQRMKALRYLNLGATRVTAAGIESLKAAMPRCEIDSVERSPPLSGPGGAPES